jgi:hypothetical protein
MEGTFVGLIEDDHGVMLEHGVEHGLTQQHTIGKEFDL